MKKGWRKLILGGLGIVSITAVALVTKDATVVLAVGGMITTLLGTVMYGYKEEYKNSEK